MLINLPFFILIFKYYIDNYHFFVHMLDFARLVSFCKFELHRFNYSVLGVKMNLFSNFQALDFWRNYLIFCLIEICSFQDNIFNFKFFKQYKYSSRSLLLYDFFVPKVDLLTAFILFMT